MKDFLEFIAKHLVDNPDHVRIVCEEKENKPIFMLGVAEPDVGKVIGRKGRTTQAMLPKRANGQYWKSTIESITANSLCHRQGDQGIRHQGRSCRPSHDGVGGPVQEAETRVSRETGKRNR